MGINPNIKVIKKFMETNGLNGAQMARRLDIDVSYMYRILNGERKPGRKFIFNAVNNLGISFEDLFDLPSKEDLN